MAESRPSKRAKRLPPASSTTFGTVRLGLVLGLLVIVNLYVFLWRGDTSIPAVMEQAALAGQKGGDPASALRNAEKRDAAATEPTGAKDSSGDSEDESDGAGATQPGQADTGKAVPEQSDEDGRWVEGKVESGDSLGRILRRENMTPPEADEVIRALSEHLDFRSIRPGQTYRIHFDDDGRLVEFEFHVSRTITVRARREADGKLVGKKDKTATQIEIHDLGGSIDSSLHAAFKSRGEDAALVAFFVDVFAYDLDFYTDTHAGDTFRMVVEKEYVDGEFLRYRRVLAAEYSGRAGTYHAFYWQPPGSNPEDSSGGSYYDAKGRSVERSLLKTPLKYARISSKFNPSRMHPILHTRRGHMGVDYAAPTGTPVWAAASGKITFRGWRGGAGNCIVVKHDGGLETVYMHLSKFRKGYDVGQYVKSKTVIGYVGTTGLSTGPHLHFGVKQDGRYIDPLKLQPVRHGGIAKKYKARFLAEIEALTTRLAGISVVSAPRELRASRAAL